MGTIGHVPLWRQASHIQLESVGSLICRTEYQSFGQQDGKPCWEVVRSVQLCTQYPKSASKVDRGITTPFWYYGVFKASLMGVAVMDSMY